MPKFENQVSLLADLILETTQMPMQILLQHELTKHFTTGTKRAAISNKDYFNELSNVIKFNPDKPLYINLITSECNVVGQVPESHVINDAQFEHNIGILCGQIAKHECFYLCEEQTEQLDFIKTTMKEELITVITKMFGKSVESRNGFKPSKLLYQCENASLQSQSITDVNLRKNDIDDSFSCVFLAIRDNAITTFINRTKENNKANTSSKPRTQPKTSGNPFRMLARSHPNITEEGDNPLLRKPQRK